MTIDMILGMLGLFVAFGATVSGLLEAINAFSHRRGRFLWRGIAGIVGEPEDSSYFMYSLRRHPALLALSQDADGHKPPSYIPGTVFASTLHAVLMAYRPSNGPRVASTADAIAAVPETYALREVLQMLWRRAEASEERFMAELAIYFELCMDRVSGWYKRDCQRNAVLLGLVLAACLNIDAMAIGRYFRDNPAYASEFAAQVARNQGGAAGVPSTTIPAAPKAPPLPIGWSNAAPGFGAAIPGFLIMAFSCLITPALWYQILVHLLPWRGAGRKPERAETSAIAQPAAPAAVIAAPEPVVVPAGDGTLNPFESAMERDGTIDALQERLSVPRTGRFDRATRAALRRAQGERNFAETGRATKHLVEELLK